VQFWVHTWFSLAAAHGSGCCWHRRALSFSRTRAAVLGLDLLYRCASTNHVWHQDSKTKRRGRDTGLVVLNKGVWKSFSVILTLRWLTDGVPSAEFECLMRLVWDWQFSSMKGALKWRLENRDEMGGYRTSPLDWFYDDVSANTDTLFNQLSKSCRACVWQSSGEWWTKESILTKECGS